MWEVDIYKENPRKLITTISNKVKLLYEKVPSLPLTKKNNSLVDFGQYKICQDIFRAFQKIRVID